MAKLVAIMIQQQKITLSFLGCLPFFFLLTEPVMAAVPAIMKRQGNVAFKAYMRKKFQLLSFRKRKTITENLKEICVKSDIDNALPLFLTLFYFIDLLPAISFHTRAHHLYSYN